MKKYIGNIIVGSKNTQVDECFKKCLDFNEVDKDIPTLIIGLNNAKKYIENFNILIKTYANNVFWTFTKTERRIDYDKDIDDFYTFCIRFIINKDKYKNINLIKSLSYSKIKKIILYIRNTNQKKFYVDNNKFVFIYDYTLGNTIFGLSLTTLRFLGIESDKVLNLIRENPNNIEIKNFYKIPNKIKKIVNDEILPKIGLYNYF